MHISAVPFCSGLKLSNWKLQLKAQSRRPGFMPGLVLVVVLLLLLLLLLLLVL